MAGMGIVARVCLVVGPRRIYPISRNTTASLRVRQQRTTTALHGPVATTLDGGSQIQWASTIGLMMLREL